MTVTELIKELERCPPNAIVCTDNGQRRSIDSVLINPATSVVVVGPLYHDSLIKNFQYTLPQ